MIHWDTVHQNLAIFSQLCWFIRLRWAAAAAVIAGTLADRLYLHWFSYHWHMLGVGIVVAGYNLVLCALTRPSPSLLKNSAALIALAWAQILPDLACLALLTMWTNDVRSPLAGLFVLHMVFASLLLPRAMAYAGAAIAWLMLAAGLVAMNSWPDPQHAPIPMGWALMLVTTVFVANHITENLRRHRERVLQQNQRIRMMSDQLRRQRQAMVQHEKMVAVGQMAAGVAHEITNPLASMDSMLQLLRRKPDRIAGETVERLAEQVGRITQIVRHLTRFAHPPEAQWQVVGIGDLIDRSLQLVRFDHRLRRVHVEQDVSPQTGQVRVQPQAIEQVLVNIILNALDAVADVPQPHLQIRASQREGQCRIEVSDNGHGIAPEHMDRLFEPFFTTKPVGKGTGLGLSISYSIVQQHGGRIEIDSQRGLGARFTICLPARRGVP
jgi:signal transduction histidine kinase